MGKSKKKEARSYVALECTECKSKLGEGSEFTFSLPIVKCEEEKKVLDSNFNLCINEYFEG